MRVVLWNFLFARPELCRGLAVELFTRQRGMKRRSRFGIERHVDLAKRLVAREASIHARQRHHFLSIVQLNTDQLLGGVHHFFGHALRRLSSLLLHRFSKDAIKVRRGEPGYSDSRKHLHKRSPIEFVIPLILCSPTVCFFLHQSPRDSIFLKCDRPILQASQCLYLHSSSRSASG